jgi:hypothetical protein
MMTEDTSGIGPTTSPPAPGEAERSGRTYRRRRGRPSKARGQPNSSDAASARWTIRGVPPSVRDIALRAAESRSMTVGDWVAEAIVTTARGADRPTPTRSNLPATDAPPDLVAMIRKLDERLSRLEDRNRPGFLGRLMGRR